MADWKIIGLSGLVNAAITIVLIILFYPLLFLGPLLGGFLAAYFTQKYKDYTPMRDRRQCDFGMIVRYHVWWFYRRDP